MTRLPLLLAALAFAGFCISGYLTVAHWGDTAIACGGVGDCEYVNSSAYATVGGLPVSGLGALVYGGMALAAVAWYARPADERLPILFWGAALAGFGYAAYLTYIELAVIEAVCVWCMTSAAILTASVLLSTAALLREQT
jgi:uncharacterized membrane protein